MKTSKRKKKCALKNRSTLRQNWPQSAISIMQILHARTCTLPSSVLQPSLNSLRTLEEVEEFKISLFCFLIHFDEVPRIASGHLMVMIIIIQFDLHFEARTVPHILILEIKDPSDHGPLILQPMFVGIFEQFVVLSELDN